MAAKKKIAVDSIKFGSTVISTKLSTVPFEDFESWFNKSIKAYVKETAEEVYIKLGGKIKKRED